VRTAKAGDAQAFLQFRSRIVDGFAVLEERAIFQVVCVLGTAGAVTRTEKWSHIGTSRFRGRQFGTHSVRP
jgi:hypothetical protein